jgi:hypothetical protein
MSKEHGEHKHHNGGGERADGGVATLGRTPLADFVIAQSLIGGPGGHVSNAALEAAPMAPNDAAWSLLYGAIVGGLGQNPASFQLVYPFTSWNWPTNPTGFTTAAQYDFCSTMPQWSATGNYLSTGVHYDGAYQQFLNLIVASTSDPVLAQQILTAQNNLTNGSNQLQTVYQQAVATYNSSVPSGTPVFTEWLTTPPGQGWAAQIQTASNNVSSLQGVLNSLTAQTKNPNLTAALQALVNQKYYVSITNGTNLNPVPQWNLSQDAAAWVQQVQGGGGQGGSISFSNAQGSYDYSQTWAQGSASVSGWFWSVYAGGSWQNVSTFYQDSSLQATISFVAWDQIGITPAQWYSGTNVFKNGPFYTGYSAYPTPGMTNMFGPKGVVAAFKTNMLVGYQPSIEVTVSNSTYQSFQQTWSGAGGFAIGPFRFGGSGSGSSLSWSQSGSQWTLKTASTSTVPIIFGVNLAIQPQ